MKHGEIGALVMGDHRGFELPAVAQDDGDVFRPIHHMLVGDDQAVGADDDARAEGVLHPLPRRAQSRIIAEELPEERVVEHRRYGPRLHHTARVDVHHRRRDLLYHRREREADLLGGFRGRRPLAPKRTARPQRWTGWRAVGRQGATRRRAEWQSWLVPTSSDRWFSANPSAKAAWPETRKGAPGGPPPCLISLAERHQAAAPSPSASSFFSALGLAAGSRSISSITPIGAMSP